MAASPKPSGASEWTPDPRSERNIATLDEKVAAIAREHLRKLDGLGLDFRVTSGRRTQAEQDALYAQGRTAPGPVVTWTRRSRHLSGRAYDLTLFRWGQPVWESPAYLVAGKIGESLGLTWGGRWKVPDKPHFELPA